MPNELTVYQKELPDGRVLEAYSLFFGAGRLTIRAVGDFTFADDVW